MRKIVNFRAPLFAAIGLIVGIFSFYEFIFGDFWFGLIAITLVTILGVTAIILKTKAWRIAVVTLVFILGGFGLSQLSYNSIVQNEALGEVVTITGRVTDIGRNGSEESKIFYLENCVTDNGQKLRGRINVYLFEDELSVDTGDVLTVSGKLYSKYAIQNDVDSRLIRNNLRYTLYDATLIDWQDGKMNLGELARKYVYDSAQAHMSDNGDIMYSLLIGDRNPLRADIVSYFSRAGILHLLAVSGLHVGFVVAVFCFILKRFKIHPLVELSILIVPLTLYAYICNFTPSVVRALIMVICTYLARAVFGRYDILTSLSLAAVFILLIKPFYLFDLGFQLSALSIYGIATLYTPLNRGLNKRKVNRFVKYIVNSLMLSSSCSLATLFTLAANFEYLPTLGVLVNLVAIPLVSVAFVLGIVGMLPWVFHYILWLADKILHLVVIIAKFVAELPFSTVTFGAIAVSIIVAVVWLFIIGGYVNFKKLGKIISHSLCAALLVLCIGLSFVRIPTTNEVFVVYGYYQAMCVATSDNGEAVIVGDFSDSSSAYDVLQYLGKRKITDCRLYFTSYDSVNVNVIDSIAQTVPVSKTYRLDFSFNATADKYLAKKGIPVTQQVKNTTNGNAVTVSSVFDAELRGTVIAVDGIVTSLVYGDDSQIESYPSLVDYADVYVLPFASGGYSEQSRLTLSAYQSAYSHNYGANKYGNFTIRQKDGKITIMFRN